MLFSITSTKPIAIFRLSLIIITALSNIGCSDKEQSKVVDFSNTITLERPDTRERGNKHLRIAIGAMVSPKESLSTYQELLDYLGKKLGEKIVSRTKENL